jgi:hypothetical protein
VARRRPPQGSKKCKYTVTYRGHMAPTVPTGLRGGWHNPWAATGEETAGAWSAIAVYKPRQDTMGLGGWNSYIVSEMTLRIITTLRTKQTSSLMDIITAHKTQGAANHACEEHSCSHRDFCPARTFWSSMRGSMRLGSACFIWMGAEIHECTEHSCSPRGFCPAKTFWSSTVASKHPGTL